MSRSKIAWLPILASAHLLRDSCAQCTFEERARMHEHQTTSHVRMETNVLSLQSGVHPSFKLLRSEVQLLSRRRLPRYPRVRYVSARCIVLQHAEQMRAVTVTISDEGQF
jgi:hypothetical protein